MSRKIRWRAALGLALLSAAAPGAAHAAAINHVPVPAGQLQHTDGALTPALRRIQPRTASTATLRPPAVACVGRDALRASPGGAVLGSIGSGEPMRVLARSKGWRRVATEFGAIGWVPSRDLCG
jgi:hypothetical protein